MEVNRDGSELSGPAQQIPPRLAGRQAGWLAVLRAPSDSFRLVPRRDSTKNG